MSSPMDAGIERPVIGKLNYNTWIGYFVAAGVVCWIMEWNYLVFTLGIMGVLMMFPLHSWYTTMDGPLMTFLMGLSAVFFTITVNNIATTIGLW